MQEKRVSVGFHGTTEQRIPAGGFIKLVAPDEVFTYNDGLECFNVSQKIILCPSNLLVFFQTGGPDEALHRNGLP